MIFLKGNSPVLNALIVSCSFLLAAVCDGVNIPGYSGLFRAIPALFLGCFRAIPGPKPLPSSSVQSRLWPSW